MLKLDEQAEAYAKRWCDDTGRIGWGDMESSFLAGARAVLQLRDVHARGYCGTCTAINEFDRLVEREGGER